VDSGQWQHTAVRSGQWQHTAVRSGQWQHTAVRSGQSAGRPWFTGLEFRCEREAGAPVVGCLSLSADLGSRISVSRLSALGSRSLSLAIPAIGCQCRCYSCLFFTANRTANCSRLHTAYCIADCRRGRADAGLRAAGLGLGLGATRHSPLAATRQRQQLGAPRSHSPARHSHSRHSSPNYSPLRLRLATTATGCGCGCRVWVWGAPATRSRAPNTTQRNQHSAGYRSPICLKNVDLRTELEKRVLYAL
jgi:hypothetical protein